MRVLVISDSHGDKNTVKMICDREQADLVLHLGDYGRDLEGGLAVRGNCDGFSSLPFSRKLRLGELDVLMTHGHRQGVKDGLNRLFYLAKEEGFDLVLFGHTHRALKKEIQGIYFINPGSISRPHYGDRASYLVLEIEGDSLKSQFKYL